MSDSLAQRIAQDGYAGYTYSYPHKTAYRPLQPPVPLGQAWAREDTSRLFLYLHLPFCEMRCGFCNLFTTVRPGQDLVEATLVALERQSREVAGLVGAGGVAQAAFGGGTPSYLSPTQLEKLFATVEEHWPVRWGQIPLSLEVSPGTVDPTKLSLLKSLGVTRLSLGAQSFLAEDLAALHRPALGPPLDKVCGWIRDTGFPVFNLDLIYGIEGQDEERWSRNLKAALRWRPEELYLYPLYVGKMTGLDKMGRRPGEQRLSLYRQARELLLAEGYQQLSKRHFRLAGVAHSGDYCCQEDPMVGLGPGARSYTSALHYSSEYAVGQKGVREIISAFATADYAHAHYGAWLSPCEQRRRDLLKSLLRVDGLDLTRYQARFGSHPVADFSSLGELFELGLARIVEARLEQSEVRTQQSKARLELTEEGLAHSDTIGPWLYSAEVQARMGEYELR